MFDRPLDSDLRVIMPKDPRVTMDVSWGEMHETVKRINTPSLDRPVKYYIMGYGPFWDYQGKSYLYDPFDHTTMEKYIYENRWAWWVHFILMTSLSFGLFMGLIYLAVMFSGDGHKKFVQDCPGAVIHYSQGKTGRDSLVCRKGEQAVSCDPIRSVTDRIGNGLTSGKVCSANQRVYGSR